MARVAERLMVDWIILRAPRIEGAYVVGVTRGCHFSNSTEGNNLGGPVLPHLHCIT